jgi:hypothetical protein
MVVGTTIQSTIQSEDAVMCSLEAVLSFARRAQRARQIALTKAK